MSETAAGVDSFPRPAQDLKELLERLVSTLKRAKSDALETRYQSTRYLLICLPEAYSSEILLPFSYYLASPKLSGTSSRFILRDFFVF